MAGGAARHVKIKVPPKAVRWIVAPAWRGRWRRAGGSSDVQPRTRWDGLVAARARRSPACSGTRRCCRCSGTTAALGAVIVVSQARDGQYLSDFAEAIGYRLVRGSSSRGAVAGAAGAPSRELRGGAIVALHARRAARAAAGAEAGRSWPRRSGPACRCCPVHAEADRGVAATFLGSVLHPEAVRPGARGLRRADRDRAGRGATGGGRGGGAARHGRGREDGAMTRRHGDTHRLIRWLWTSRRLDARLARARRSLPAAALWRAGMGLRELAYRRGWRATHDLPLPVGRGRQPDGGRVGQDADRHLDRPALTPRGACGPGSCSAGYGATRRWCTATPCPRRWWSPIPTGWPARRAAAAQGAQVLVLDDAFQRLDVRRDLNVAVVSAETTRAVRWPLPAGPWREGWGRSSGPTS